MADLLQQLQLDCAAYLQQSNDLQYVPTFVVRPRADDGAAQIQDRINHALTGITGRNGKSGLTVLVGMPTVRNRGTDAKGPQLITEVPIEIVEHLVTNEGTDGTGTTAEDMGLIVCNLLHHWRPNQHHHLYGADRLLQPIDYGEDFVAYLATFEILDGLQPPDRVPAPSVTGNASIYTVTGSDVNYAVYFTANGSFPAPDTGTESDGNPRAGMAGLTIRAMAYPTDQHLLINPDAQPSQLTELLLT